jgi:hypothetical protein
MRSIWCPISRKSFLRCMECNPTIPKSPRPQCGLLLRLLTSRQFENHKVFVPILAIVFQSVVLRSITPESH